MHYTLTVCTNTSLKLTGFDLIVFYVRFYMGRAGIVF